MHPRRPGVTSGWYGVTTLVFVGIGLLAQPVGAQRGLGPGGGLADGFASQEIPIVAQFDRDGDGRLDDTERAVAREWLASRGGGGGLRGDGGRGGPGGARGMVAASSGIAVSPGEVRAFGSESLYDLGVLRTIFIELDGDDWESELVAFFNTDVEVPATVIVDGKTFPNVGVGFRGASSFRMVPHGSKRPLKLSANFVDGDQRIVGYRTLNLLNAMNDPTFVRTALYSQIAQDYIAAPKVNFVRVVINGEDWGVYLNAQQYNKDFLEDFFRENDGRRWKAPGSPNGRAGMEYLGDAIEPYRAIYEIKTKDEPEEWTDLINLFKVLNETPAAQLEAALAPIFDIDGALKFLALEVALVNSDGYWTRASDYNIYQNEGGRFHIIPHDMNEAIGVSGNIRLDPLVGLDDPSKPLRSKLLAVPALRERYLTYVEDIATRWLDWERLGPIIFDYQALIREAVELDARKLYGTAAFSSGVGELRQFVESRREFLLR